MQDVSTTSQDGQGLGIVAELTHVTDLDTVYLSDAGLARMETFNDRKS